MRLLVILSRRSSGVILIAFLLAACGRADESLIKKTYPVKALAASAARGDDLIESITTVVASTSWENVGGEGSIAWSRGELTVRNSQAACDQVAKLLAELQKLPRVGSKEWKKAPEAVSIPVGGGKAKSELEVVVYPIHDLIVNALNADTEVLEQLINTFVAPESWGIVGGDCSLICYVPRGAMLIAQRKTNHHQIAAMLTAFRKLASSKKPRETPDPVSLHIADSRTGSGEQQIAIYPLGDLVADGHAGAVDFESVIELVLRLLEPSSWDSEGGSGNILGFDRGRGLVVSNSKQVHANIVKLLTVLRATPRLTKATAKRKPQPPALVATETRGDNEVQIIAYDVGSKVLTAAGEADFDSLLEKLDSLDSKLWAASGGPGDFLEFADRGVIIVAHTKDVQEQVAKAISDFRSAR